MVSSLQNGFGVLTTLYSGAEQLGQMAQEPMSGLEMNVAVAATQVLVDRFVDPTAKAETHRFLMTAEVFLKNRDLTMAQACLVKAGEQIQNMPRSESVFKMTVKGITEEEIASLQTQKMVSATFRALSDYWITKDARQIHADSQVSGEFPLDIVKALEGVDDQTPIDQQTERIVQSAFFLMSLVPKDPVTWLPFIPFSTTEGQENAPITPLQVQAGMILQLYIGAIQILANNYPDIFYEKFPIQNLFESKWDSQTRSFLGLNERAKSLVEIYAKYHSQEYEKLFIKASRRSSVDCHEQDSWNEDHLNKDIEKYDKETRRAQIAGAIGLGIVGCLYATVGEGPPPSWAIPLMFLSAGSFCYPMIMFFQRRAEPYMNTSSSPTILVQHATVMQGLIPAWRLDGILKTLERFSEISRNKALKKHLSLLRERMTMQETGSTAVPSASIADYASQFDYPEWRGVVNALERGSTNPVANPKMLEALAVAGGPAVTDEPASDAAAPARVKAAGNF